ncbi:type II toxin-antitoxin system HicA family toxin [Marinitenerispora sediminis]|uniref:type II toxin-antitoxin system HicA family toxin n=1 Tax=Marinitenerispora sediminis TaxID=1931232 RepID=UPI0011C02C66|nr:type II toxin-antitoxin system HicA family toxin [Marinitenerispora sediminis]
MKHGALISRLQDIAKRTGLSLDLVRHGGNHDLYRIGSVARVVGRHREIPEQTARGTIRKAEQA